MTAGDHSAATPDVLLRCLVYLTGFHGQAKSSEALIAGLAHDERGMNPALFMTAANRAGLKVKYVQGREFSQIPDAVLPCVIGLGQGRYAILKSRKGDNAVIWDPLSAQERVAPIQDVAKKYDSTVFFVRPKPFFIDRSLLDTTEQSMAWFWDTIQSSRDVYAKVLLASVLINLFALVSPVYVMNVYDRVIPNNAIETGWALGIGALIVYVFDLAIRTLRGYFTDFAGRKTDVVVSRRVFDQLLDMKLSGRPASSGSFANMLREFDSVRDFMTSATMTGLIDLPFALLFLLVIFVLGGPLGIVICFLMLAVVVAGVLIQVPLRHHVRSAMRSAEVKHGLLVETISGLETIKAIGADGKIRARYGNNVAENALAGQNSRHYSSIGVNVATFVQQVSSVLVILWGMYLVRDGAMSMGALIATVMLSGRALSPIAQVANLMSRYHQAAASLKTLNNIMSKPVERPADKVFLHRPVLNGDIKFDKVSFVYPRTDRRVLDQVSFTIRAGEKVGIVGRIGSGKSTIARLIIQLYDPLSGSILIDSTDSRQIDPADLRRNIAYIAQDVTLFQGTIRDNITASRPSATDDDIMEAAKAAGAHDFIAQHPAGYDAPVGERGEGLSGGQKQCIALARAILLKPSVYVCDEPTNDMDTQSEERFFKYFSKESAGKTVVLITHRASLLPLVDRLVVIDKGRVVADGPREKVMEALAAGKIEVPR